MDRGGGGCLKGGVSLLLSPPSPFEVAELTDGGRREEGENEAVVVASEEEDVEEVMLSLHKNCGIAWWPVVISGFFSQKMNQ